MYTTNRERVCVFGGWGGGFITRNRMEKVKFNPIQKRKKTRLRTVSSNIFSPLFLLLTSRSVLVEMLKSLITEYNTLIEQILHKFLYTTKLR